MPETKHDEDDKSKLTEAIYVTPEIKDVLYIKKGRKKTYCDVIEQWIEEVPKIEELKGQIDEKEKELNKQLQIVKSLKNIILDSGSHPLIEAMQNALKDVEEER